MQKQSTLPVFFLAVAAATALIWGLVNGQIMSTKQLMDDRARVAAAVSVSSTSSASSEASSSSSSSDSEPMQTLVITDQDYNTVPGKTGLEWVKAIGTVKLSGNVRDAEIHFDLSRGNDNRGWSGLGMYFAKPTANGGIDPATEWRHVRYVGAFWNGTCKRNLDPDSPFGVLHEHSNTIDYPLSAIQVSSDDPCDTYMGPLDLAQEINNGGAYVGFLPSAASYHAKVTIHYRGTLNVEHVR